MTSEFRLTSQKQKETAGIPEYARKGKAALSKENSSLKGKQECVSRKFSQEQTVLPCNPTPIPK